MAGRAFVDVQLLVRQSLGVLLGALRDLGDLNQQLLAVQVAAHVQVVHEVVVCERHEQLAVDLLVLKLLHIPDDAITVLCDVMIED